MSRVCRCGASLEGEHPNRKRCRTCSRLRHNEACRRWRNKHNPRDPGTPPEPTPETLAKLEPPPNGLHPFAGVDRAAITPGLAANPP